MIAILIINSLVFWIIYKNLMSFNNNKKLLKSDEY